MNRRIRHFLKGIIMASALGIFIASQALVAYAASGRIAFSDKSVSVGSEVSINMKITAAGGAALSNATVMLNYDASMMEFVSGTGASGGAGSIRITIGGDTADANTLNSELKFKALQAGTAKVTVNTQEVYDTSNQVVEITQMGDSTITIAALANASKDATLAGLEISPGTLTPEFSPEVTNYTATVGADVEKLTINAPATDGKATVVLSGNEGLQMGENQVVCKVIAEDGQTVTDYTIVVTKAEGGESGTSTSDPSAVTVDVVTAAKTVKIIPLEDGVEIPEGFKECLLKIDGVEVQGWVWASETDYQYCVFYGQNEAGEKDFYRYDITEKTMQRYFQDPMSAAGVSMEQYVAVAEAHNELLKDYDLRLYVIIALIVVSVILLIVVIMLASKNKKPYDDDDKKYRNYKEKLDEKKKPKTSRRITREERYMRGLEAEEQESFDDFDSLDVTEEALRDDLAREVEKPAARPAPRTSSRIREERRPVSDDDDDDFEFIDLDL